MIIKKFIVSDMKEAIIRAKYELGNDAIIISQRNIKVGKWYHPFKKDQLEVTVALEGNGMVTNNRMKNIEEVKDLEKVNEINHIENMKEMNPVYSLKEALHVEPPFPNASSKMLEQLLNYCKLHSKENHHFTIQEKIDFFKSVFKGNGFDKQIDMRRINVIIGPTGVGKTTTIAKIAAKEYLINKKKVGLITLDTYRIGAVEQVKTYASILGLPCEVVDEPSEMENRINKLSYCDLLLIDTLGTSQKNKEKLNDIEQYLQKIKDNVNIFLVLSISTDWETNLSILDKYKKLKYNAIILTKLDEVYNYKNLWKMVETNEYPIQYLCNGQDVPENICDATIENLIAYCEENYHDD